VRDRAPGDASFFHEGKIGRALLVEFVVGDKNIVMSTALRHNIVVLRRSINCVIE